MAITNDATGVIYAGDGAPVDVDNQLIAKFPLNFQVFGSPDSASLVQEALTSAPTQNAGIRGTPTYSALGADFSNGGDGLAGINWEFTQEETDLLDISGSISFEVHNSQFLSTENQPTFNVGYMSTFSAAPASGNEASFIRRLANNFYLDTTNITVISTVSRFVPSFRGKPFHRIDISWSGDNYQIFVNQLMGVDQPRDTMDNNVMRSQWLGSSKLSQIAEQGASFRNYMVSTDPIFMPSTRTSVDMICTGDSFMVRGDYPEEGQGATRWAITNTVGGGSQDPNFETGMVCNAHRVLAQNDIFVRDNKIRNTGEAFIGIKHQNAFNRDFTSVVDDFIGSVTSDTVVFINLGINDVGNTVDVPDSDFTDGTLKALYLTQIDRIITAGCKKLVINTTTPTGMEPALDGPQFEQRTTDLNTVITQITNERTQVRLFDAFTYFNGFSYDPLDFGGANPGAADRHPSVNSNWAFGEQMALISL